MEQNCNASLSTFTTKVPLTLPAIITQSFWTGSWDCPRQILPNFSVSVEYGGDLYTADFGRYFQCKNADHVRDFLEMFCTKLGTIRLGFYDKEFLISKVRIHFNGTDMSVDRFREKYESGNFEIDRNPQI